MGTLNLKTASGGSVTLSPANTASDVTITVPASNASMATDVSTLAQFNASGAAPVYACRAWVNFNGSGTVAIRASGNVSSITDLSAGTYSVNLTVSMADTNYATVATTGDSINAAFKTTARPISVSAIYILILQPNVAYYDDANISLAVFR